MSSIGNNDGVVRVHRLEKDDFSNRLKLLQNTFGIAPSYAIEDQCTIGIKLIILVLVRVFIAPGRFLTIGVHTKECGFASRDLVLVSLPPSVHLMHRFWEDDIPDEELLAEQVRFWSIHTEQPCHRPQIVCHREPSLYV